MRRQTKPGPRKAGARSEDVRRLVRKPTAQKKALELTVSLEPFLVDGTDLQFRDFVADIFAVAAGMQSLRRALAQSVKLSAAELSVLLAIWRLQRKGGVSVITAARYLHVAAAHVTAEVGKLARKGLVKKSRDSNDTRAVSLVLTAKGEGILRELAPSLRQINDRLFSGNSANAVRIVAKFLKHVAGETANAVRMARSFQR